jgi:phosphoglycolate phosphatase-like HAD superfamily hydrolase
VKHSKPDPDSVRKALQKSRIPRTKTIFVGDTPYDIEAAARAEISCIALRSGGWRDGDLTGATMIFDDVGGLYQNLRNLGSKFRKTK